MSRRCCRSAHSGMCGARRPPRSPARPQADGYRNGSLRYDVTVPCLTSPSGAGVVGDRRSHEDQRAAVPAVSPPHPQRPLEVDRAGPDAAGGARRSRLALGGAGAAARRSRRALPVSSTGPSVGSGRGGPTGLRPLKGRRDPHASFQDYRRARRGRGAPAGHDRAGSGHHRRHHRHHRSPIRTSEGCSCRTAGNGSTSARGRWSPRTSC